ncbi:hypothetical protein OPIT5_22660 [Opitutaceae bacterium TAV5]|nr:hypothetical protein OPIT5_22660 [Opitutaceae bacterium TAV5]
MISTSVSLAVQGVGIVRRALRVAHVLRVARGVVSLVPALAGALAFFLAAPLRAATPDITGTWHFAGLSTWAETEGGAQTAGEPSEGTLTITASGGDYTLTPGGEGWLFFDEPATVPLHRSGNLYSFSDSSDGSSPSTGETTWGTILWIDANTALIHYVAAEVVGSGSGEGNLLWLEGFAGVLTRNPLPAADPAKWTGTFSGTEIYIATDEGDGPGVNSVAAQISAGSRTGEYVIRGGDGESDVARLSDDGQSLHFLETDGNRWRDELAGVQLADGRIAYAFYGIENSGGAITFADLGVGILTPGSVTEPEPEPDAPVITAQPVSRTVWQGEGVTFSVSASGEGPLAYQWYLNGKAIKNAKASTWTIAKTTKKNAGNYTVKVSNAGGEITSAAAVLTVEVPVKPKFTLQPKKQETGLGQSVTFTALATANPAPAYQWRLNGVNIPGATGESYTIASVTAADIGKYTVVATSGPNTATSKAAELTAVLPPEIVTPSSGEIVALASKGAKLSVKLAKNKAKPSYQWLLDGVEIPGATKATWTAKADGVYSVRVSNSAGSVTGEIGTVKLITPPKITSITASTTSIVAGDSVTFTAELQDGTGTAPLTWTWLLNGKPIPDAPNGPTLVVSGIAKTGKYSVQVTNGEGKVVGKAKSKAITIKVVEPPAIVVQPVAYLALAEGKSGKLSVKATGTSKLVYQWFRDGQPIAGATKSTLSLKKFTLADAGNYTVTVDNPAGRPVTSSAALVVMQSQGSGGMGNPPAGVVIVPSD